MVEGLTRYVKVLFSQIARESEGYQPLVASAMGLALEGRTSLDEVLILGDGDLNDGFLG
jgi:MSHA biogenesis protein MshE